MPGRQRQFGPDDMRDVLAGRRHPRLEELFDFVHAINPTGRELSEARSAEAYATKARLQSLLIERFGEALVVDEVAGTDGNVVGLRHRTYAKDACHAVVAQLSAAAQAWVRRQRDLRLAETEQPSSPTKAAARSAEPAPQPDGPAGLLASGEAALANYDFDRARELLAAVLATPLPWTEVQVHVRAARALLELLVDSLADNAGALALRERWPPVVTQDDRVRCLLALAAARRGDRSLATKLVAGLEVARVHEVSLELAKRALATGDLVECEQHLARIPSGSAQAAAVHEVAAAARSTRAERARPLERQLERALARGGDLTVAERLAHDILALNERSDVAHRALAAWRQAQQVAQATELTARLEAALAATDSTAAALLLRQLESVRGACPQFHERLEAVRAQEEREREERAVADLAQSLQGECTARVVAAFWSATDAVRRAARARVVRPQVDWLEDIGPVKGSAASAAAAAAALALPHAERDFAEGRAASAWQALALHEETVRAGPRGRDLIERVHSAVRAERARVARARLTEAETASESRARELLSILADADLDDDGRARRDALAQRLQQAAMNARARRARARLLVAVPVAAVVAAGIGWGVHTWVVRASRSADEVAFDDAERSGDLVAARAAASRLLATAVDEPRRAQWRASFDQLNRDLRARWVEDEGSGAAVVAEWADLCPRVTGPCVCVAPDGESVFTVDRVGQRAFVRCLHRDPTLARAAMLRTHEGFRLAGLHVEDQVLHLLGAQQAVRVDHETFDVADTLLFGPLEEGPITSVRFVPGRRSVWLDWARTPEMGSLPIEGQAVTAGTTIVDRVSGEPDRSLTQYKAVVPVWGLSPPAVVISHALTDFGLYDDRGNELCHDDGEFVFHTAAVHPDGRSFIVFKSRPRPMAQGSGFALLAEPWSVDGQRGQELGLAWLPRGKLEQAATALACGRTYAVAEVGEDQHVLFALRTEGGKLVEAWRVPVPANVTLANDADSRYVFACSNDGEQVQWVRLSESPPRELAATAPPPQFPPSLDPYGTCAWQPDALRYRVAAYTAVLALVDAPSAAARVRALLDGAFDVTTGAALWLAGPSQLRPVVLQRLTALHGNAPETKVIVAEQSVHEGKHEAAARALDGLDGQALPPTMSRHVAHLRALCALALGREGDAPPLLRAALPLASADNCALEPLLEWTEALSSPLDELLAKNPRGATRRAVVGRLRAGDQALASGDVEGARRWFDHPAVWLFTDHQTLARLAETYLRCSPQDGAMRVRQRFVLAGYCHLWASDFNPRLNLGRAAWPASRLDDVAERARRWLGDPPSGNGKRSESSRRVPGAALDDVAFITTMVPVGMRSTRAGLIDAAESAAVLQKHAQDLAAEARAVLAGRQLPRVVGLVLDPAHPLAEHYRMAREQLRGTRGGGPEPAVVVTLTEAFRILADWPYALDRFQDFNNTSILEGRLSLLLLRPHAAGWMRVSP